MLAILAPFSSTAADAAEPANSFDREIEIVACPGAVGRATAPSTDADGVVPLVAQPASTTNDNNEIDRNAQSIKPRPQRERALSHKCELRNPEFNGLCKTPVEHGAGSSLDDVLKCNVCCTSVEKFAALNAIYARYFPVDPPARIFVSVPEWPGHFGIEIDCIATV